MGDTKHTIQVPTLEGDTKSGDPDSSICGDTNVSMPICFLVKEQAKSCAAIQDLQGRLTKVECVQEDVVGAIVDIRNFLSDSRNFSSLSSSPAAAPTAPLTADMLRHHDAKEESDKQDSGLESAASLHHQHHPQQHQHGDELLRLLDEIESRSAAMQQQGSCNVSPPPQPKQSPGEGAPRRRSVSELAGLYGETVLNRTAKGTGDTTVGPDAATVSSVLRESSRLDLQRLALVYLADNAVLQTRLCEAERALAARRVHDERMQTSLREETRLLMLEGRELRLEADELRSENRQLRGRVMQLEGVLRAQDHHHPKAGWQLQEPRFSQSYSHPTPTSVARNTRRSSLPNDHFSCTKSKLLSDNSSYLDITLEEPQVEPSHSTPLANQGRRISGGTFSSIKHNLQKNRTTNIPNADSNFPFNMILEKLKSETEYRLTKTPIKDGPGSRRADADPTNDKSAPAKKSSRDIQQRIQNILDRIVAESEEAS